MDNASCRIVIKGTSYRERLSRHRALLDGKEGDRPGNHKLPLIKNHHVPRVVHSPWRSLDQCPQRFTLSLPRQSWWTARLYGQCWRQLMTSVSSSRSTTRTARAARHRQQSRELAKVWIENKEDGGVALRRPNGLSADRALPRE